VLAGHVKRTPSEEAAQVMASLGGGIAGQLAYSQGAVGIVASVTELLTRELVKATIVNPEQQRQELEADQVGLFLMARAGYDPQKAVDFWTDLNETGETDSAIPILSSHPPSNKRLNQLDTILPDARAEYLATKNRNPASQSE